MRVRQPTLYGRDRSGRGRRSGLRRRTISDPSEVIETAGSAELVVEHVQPTTTRTANRHLPHERANYRRGVLGCPSDLLVTGHGDIAQFNGVKASCHECGISASCGPRSRKFTLPHGVVRVPDRRCAVLCCAGLCTEGRSIPVPRRSRVGSSTPLISWLVVRRPSTKAILTSACSAGPWPDCRCRGSVAAAWSWRWMSHGGEGRTRW